MYAALCAAIRTAAAAGSSPPGIGRPVSFDTPTSAPSPITITSEPR